MNHRFHVGTLLLWALTLTSDPQLAAAQSKANDPMRARTGAEWCETLKGDEVTLRSIIKNNPAKQSATIIESFQRTLVAQEKETKKCCNDPAQCKRDFESSPAKSAPRSAPKPSSQ